jgi:hypothetical protein
LFLEKEELGFWAGSGFQSTSSQRPMPSSNLQASSKYVFFKSDHLVHGLRTNCTTLVCSYRKASLGPCNIGCESSTLGKGYGIKCGDIGSLEKTSGIWGTERVENTSRTWWEHI